jgi:hypothetical protein
MIARQPPLRLERLMTLEKSVKWKQKEMNNLVHIIENPEKTIAKATFFVSRIESMSISRRKRQYSMFSRVEMKTSRNDRMNQQKKM